MLSILTDSLHKIAYSTDASIYREVPRGVAYPESTQDIVELVNEARRLNTCLIPRAAGTSVAGQVVGKGIVVDIKGVTRSNYGAPLLLVVGYPAPDSKPSAMHSARKSVEEMVTGDV